MDKQQSVSKEVLAQMVSHYIDSRTEIKLFQRQGGTRQLLANLNVDPARGISQKEIQERIHKFGSNKRQRPESASYCELVIQAFEDFTLRILLISAIISITIEMITAPPEERSIAWIDGAVILLAVVICVNVAAFNDYQKEKHFQQLYQIADSRKIVILKRDGEFKEIHQENLVVGDIVKLSQGMELPADGVVLEASQITCDQASMTGEAEPTIKQPFQSCLKYKSGDHQSPSCVILSGSRILTGQGTMVVTVVGPISAMGKIQEMVLREDDSQTPLKQKLEKVSTQIGYFGLTAGILVFVILVGRMTAQCIQQQSFQSKRLVQIMHYFMLAVAVVVMAIPEGLPLAVTLSLAYSVTKMLSDNNLVRRMQACETMGVANCICSDKTGTITQNKMTLTTLWADQFSEVDSLKKLNFFGGRSTSNELLKVSMSCNNGAMLYPNESGSRTDVAILQFIQKQGIRYEQVRKQIKILKKLPFSSARKRMSIVIEFQGRLILLVKGASDIVLQCCSHVHSRNDQVKPITALESRLLKDSITKMTTQALRTLALAYKQIRGLDQLREKDSLGVFQDQKNGLNLLCLIGLRDMPRPQVYEAIKDCRTAGIRVRMVTGDNPLTAAAIAKEVGIIQDPSNSLTLQGPQFIKRIGGLVCAVCRTAVCSCPTDAVTAKLQNKPLRVDQINNKIQFDKIVEKLDVLARSRPQDKYALVVGLTQRGDVVAVTGDGTNDAPALKRADVGLAMGISGTEVARESAAIILLDDNFSSIVKSVLWGRNIYDSIFKFIQFQLTVNIVAVFTSVIGSGLFKQEVLTIIQVLWINMMMDTLASLALATEPPTQSILRRKPASREARIVDKRMLTFIVAQAIYQITVLFTIIFKAPYFIPEVQDNQVDGLIRNKIAGHFHIPVDKDYYPRFREGNQATGMITFGNLMSIDGQEVVYRNIFQATGIHSRHFTMLFNVFVCLQYFNFFCCRKIRFELNLFEGITRNPIFILIMVCILVFQFIFVTFASKFFGSYSFWGLTPAQWGISVALGSGTMLVDIIMKLLTKRFFMNPDQQ